MWTAEQARAMSRRGAEASRLSRLRNPPKPRPTPDPKAPSTFQSRRLSRVRAQLDMLDRAIERELRKPEPDGQRVDRLAAASMRLSDQEFALDGRGKPALVRDAALVRGRRGRDAVAGGPVSLRVMPVPASSTSQASADAQVQVDPPSSADPPTTPV